MHFIEQLNYQYDYERKKGQALWQMSQTFLFPHSVGEGKNAEKERKEEEGEKEKEGREGRRKGKIEGGKKGYIKYRDRRKEKLLI